MKYKHLLLAFSILFSITASAQDINWGAKAGYNLSNATQDNFAEGSNLYGLDDEKTRSGYHVGLFANKMISEKFGLQTELLYSQKGTQFKLSDDSDAERELKLDYLVMPVLAKFHITEGFNIYSGMQLEHNLKALGEIEDGSGNNILERDLRDSDVVKDFMFTIPMGLGYTSKGGISVDARYDLGLTAIYEVQDSGEDIASKNRALLLGIGYTIGSF